MATAVAVVSLIATAVGAGVQYSAQRRAAKATEAAAEYNAAMQRRRAEQESDIAAENARRKSEQKRRRLASLRARAAGDGVSFTGSVVDQLEDSAFVLERDIQSDVYASQLRTSAMNQQADLTLFEGRSQAAGQRMNANAQLLSGGMDVATQLAGGFRSGSFRIS